MLRYILLNALLFMSGLIGCNENELVLKFMLSEGEVAVQNDKFELSFYIFDDSIEDMPAIKVFTYNLTHEKFPSFKKIKLEHSKIKSILKSKGLSKSYLGGYWVLNWDSNADGRICQGDLTLLNTPILDYYKLKKSNSLELEVVKNSTPCFRN